MPIKAFLYDATGTDREVKLDAELVNSLHDRQLLWVDVGQFTEAEIRSIGALFSLSRESVSALLRPGRRPRLDNYGAYFQLNVETIQEADGKYSVIELNFIMGENLIVTVHQDDVAFLASFDRRIKGDSELGELDAPSFLAALLDWHVTSYFRLIDLVEAQIDRIDAHALKPRHTRDLLSELARLRQRVAFIRRRLTPHREVYAAMARPDFHLQSTTEVDSHYIALNDRLDRAIEAIENARELLVGSFDMFTTQTTLRTNETIKVLTLVSFVWLPASVIVGIAGLLLKTPVYSIGREGFWWMLTAIGLIGLCTLSLARWRRWI
jgi:Mg2+ and Co2+ transporter CorA